MTTREPGLKWRGIHASTTGQNYSCSSGSILHFISTSAEDVEQHVFDVLDYVTACINCLEVAKDKRQPLRCDSFCKDCFINKAVSAAHKDLFTEWQCDIRSCVHYGRLSQQGNRNTHCLSFRVLVSISDQDSTYEKYGRSVSYSLQELLNGQVLFLFLIFIFMTFVIMLRMPRHL